jgi:hypothetical protein
VPGPATRIELYLSVLQRKVLTPNDCTILDELAARIHAFGRRYSALGRPFAWRFTRTDLQRLLDDPALHIGPQARMRPPPSCPAGH